MCLNSTDTPSPSSPSMPPILHAPHHTQTHGHTLSHFTNTHGHTLSHFTNTHAHTYTFTNTHHNTHTHTLSHTHTHSQSHHVSLTCAKKTVLMMKVLPLYARLNAALTSTSRGFTMAQGWTSLKMASTSHSTVGQTSKSWECRWPQPVMWEGTHVC